MRSARPRLFARLLLAAVLCLPVAAARAEDPPTIDPSTAAAALNAASNGNPPPNVVITPSQTSDGTKLAHVQTHADGTIEITVFVPTFDSTFLLSARYGGLNTTYAKGILCGTFMHELAHLCDGYTGSTPQEPYSCEHIAIRYGVAMAECSMITGLMMGKHSEEDRLFACGLCADYREQQRFLNQECTGERAVRACLCAQPPYQPPTNCPNMTMPPLPPGGCPDGHYPGCTVLPDCDICDTFECP